MSGKSCGAIAILFHNGIPFVLVEYMKNGSVSLPREPMKEGESETDTAARAIRELMGAEVPVDDAFRHEAVYSPEPGAEMTVVFFIVSSRFGSAFIPFKDEVKKLEWRNFRDAVRDVTCDSDREALHHAASFVQWKYYHVTWTGHGGPAFPLLRYREHAVDVHSHMIPGVDDGAQTMKEARELALLDRAEGMDVVFCTPHYGIENGYAPDRRLVCERFDTLYNELNCCQGENPNPRLYSGTEWYCAEDIVERIRNREALPMGESDWYMVEFLEWGKMTEPAEVILSRLGKMKRAGIRTILAHAERYTAVQADWDLAKRICDLGVLLQVNAYDLCLNKNPATRNLARWMAQERLISFIGSDMHGTRIKGDGKPARKPQMKEGVRWLYENLDGEYADRVVRRNAEDLLGVKKLPVSENKEFIPEGCPAAGD